MSDVSSNAQPHSVLLRLHADELSFVLPVNAAAEQSRTASVAPIRALLSQIPLSESRVERAIYAVEDLIMPILRSLPSGLALVISGPDLVPVFDLLSASPDAAVSIESVESLFNQFADHVGGSPIAWRHSVPAVDAALGLVVLREVMHHGGFRSVSLPP